jgi:glucose/mannose transport system permease protein
MAGAFIPLQVFIYPLVRITSSVGLFGSLPGVILLHICFSLPLMTLLFRNFYAGIPVDLFKAARVDGAGFWQLFGHVLVPMSVPIIVVALIIQITGTWNDFILGLIFAGSENMPITVLLNNVVNSQFGEREYNVNMAATILTGLVPLVLYFVSGRWFVRGIMAGAVKG